MTGYGKESQNMSVAVIGAGNWGKNLVRTFHKLNVLSAVIETSEELRSKISTEYSNIKVFNNLKQLFATEIPAVAIVTPVSTHYQIAKEALLAGKDVFVEKPMTLSVSEADELVKLAQSKNRVLMVGHLLLYQSAIQWIKNYINSESLGRIYSFHQERLNLGKARAVENALWSLGVHDIAVLLFLTGQVPESLQVTGQSALQSDIEDDIYLHLSFPSGIQAHLHNSWLWPGKQRKLTIIGSKGILVYDEQDQTIVLHHKGINPDLSNRDEGSEVLFKGDGEPLIEELSHFLECVSNRKTPISNGQSGVAVIKVLEEATQLLKGELKSE